MTAGLLRCGESCRLRLINYLQPDLKRGNFTEEVDELIIKLHEFFGNNGAEHIILEYDRQRKSKNKHPDLF
ncbi:unnamed protein product [Urochloa humidicola]